jgi:hypothetical protein
MRRPGIDLDFVRDPGALQFPGKRRDVLHAHGAVGAAVGYQDRRRIGRIGLTLGRGKPATLASLEASDAGGSIAKLRSRADALSNSPA